MMNFSLAVCGSEISDEQIKLLLDYLKIEELILGFDKEYKDPYGWDGELYKINYLRKYVRLFHIVKSQSYGIKMGY